MNDILLGGSRLFYWALCSLCRRKLSQPLRERSAGSVFRNPPDLSVSAAELIERSGLKGFKIGGAVVSNKHANFFVNSGDASSQNMLELIGLVKETVEQRFGVKLKEEVLYVHPYFQNFNPNMTASSNH